MSKCLGIVGQGNIGSALGQVFADNGWRVEYFDTEPHKGTVASLKILAQQSDFIIIAAPSFANRAIATEVLPYAMGKLVATVAKGVEPGFVSMYEMLEEVSGGQFTSAVLYGPMLAAEIAEQKPGTIMLASKNQGWNADFNENSQMKLVYHDDPYSVALCGILKNIFALALGLHDGLKLGNNSKGVLTVKIIEEYQALLYQLGGNPELALSVVGLGDLVTTGWSEYSFNYRMGKKLAVSVEHPIAKGEGVTSIKELGIKVNLNEHPVSSCLYKILFADASPMSLGKLAN